MKKTVFKANIYFVGVFFTQEINRTTAVWLHFCEESRDANGGAVRDDRKCAIAIKILRF